jgi:hypothetical protein
LISHANGEIDLSTTQVKAAQIVIGKFIPDLKAVEHSGNQDKPIRHVVEWEK